MIRQATYEDLNAISSVHFRCFPESLSTKIGSVMLENCEPLLMRFYAEYLKVNPELFLVSTDDNNNPVGFCMGYYCEHNDFVEKYIRKNFRHIFMRVVVLLFKLDNVAWKKFKSFITPQKSAQIVLFTDVFKNMYLVKWETCCPFVSCPNLEETVWRKN